MFSIPQFFSIFEDFLDWLQLFLIFHAHEKSPKVKVEELALAIPEPTEEMLAAFDDKQEDILNTNNQYKNSELEEGFEEIDY